VRLTGTLSDLWPGGQIVVQYSRIGRHHELRLWVRHLALHAAQDSTTVSALVGRPAKDEGVASVCFTPVADPLPLLTDLLRLYRLGQRVPLRFFAHASRVFAQKMASARTEHAAWEAARDAFKPNEHRPSDSGDAYVAEIYPNDPPFEADAPDAISFADAALAVYRPFLRHREVRK
jgi:exonuclease V gamma subunit